MVMARLHLICGNCGSNDDWEWEHQAEEVLEGEVMSDEDTKISCGNCGTIHSLNDNAERPIKILKMEVPHAKRSV